MQLYLKQLLEMFFHPQPTVRFTAFSVVDMILGRGLVHPVQVMKWCRFGKTYKFLTNHSSICEYDVVRVVSHCHWD